MFQGAIENVVPDSKSKVSNDLSANEEIHVVGQTCNNNSLDAGAVPDFLRDKESQQSIVQLRDRMVKYYTVSVQLR